MALNVAWHNRIILQWKVNAGFKKLNSWPLGAGGVNMHFAYWSSQLNVKVPNEHIKKTNKCKI